MAIVIILYMILFHFEEIPRYYKTIVQFIDTSLLHEHIFLLWFFFIFELIFISTWNERVLKVKICSWIRKNLSCWDMVSKSLLSYTDQQICRLNISYFYHNNTNYFENQQFSKTFGRKHIAQNWLTFNTSKG